MNPLLKLMEMMNQPSSYVGTVLSVDGKRVRVSGSKGIQTLENTTTMVLQSGDSVVVRMGSVVGKLRPSTSVQEYFV